MYGAVQSGGRSPKPLNNPVGTPQLKHGSDSIQDSNSPVASQVKGKKKDRSEQGSDPVKRERSSKTDDPDSGQFKPEHILKSEIAKITVKGGLVDFEGVEKLVQLMQPDSAEKKINLACRIMLVDVIAVTDRFDCLGWFVQLRGLPVLDEWLQELHKGKIGDGISPKESDKSAEEFLFALLRALDKLPVNLHALQNCNVGKSVNLLVRSHKNSEIQKKAKSLVDTWKERVRAEIKMIEAKAGPSGGGSWPTKSVLSEVSHIGNRRIGGSSEVGMKSSILQSSAAKTTPVKLGSGEDVSKFASESPGSTKLAASMTTSMGTSAKDASSASLVGGGASDLPLSTIKEEKSSSSSQSQNNSQSCSSDHAKMGGSSYREDARTSTAGSPSVNKISSSASGHWKLSKSPHGSAVSGVQNETDLGKFSLSNRSSTTEKFSPTRVADIPPVDQGNSHRLIVRLPNTVQSLAQTASGGSFEDPTTHDQKVKGKFDALQVTCASSVDLDSFQGKGTLAGSDEGNVSSTGTPCDERSSAAIDGEKLSEASKFTGLSSRITPNQGKPFDASFSSINALIESCVKLSEASTSASGGDDIGMNLLASVAAGEMPRSDASPLGSPGRNSPVPEDPRSGNDLKLRQLDEHIARNEEQLNDVAHSASTAEQVNSVDSVCVNIDSQHRAMPASTNFSGNSKVTSFGCEDKMGERSAQLDSSIMDLQQNACCPRLTSDGNSSKLICNASLAMSSVDAIKEVKAEDNNVDQFIERSKLGSVQLRNNSVSHSKFKAKSPMFDEDKKLDYAEERTVENSVVMVPEVVVTSAKVENGANEESHSPSSLGMCKEEKDTVKKESDCGFLTEQMSSLGTKLHLKSTSGKSADTLPSCSGSALVVESQAEKAGAKKVESRTEQTGEQKVDLGSPNLDHKSECAEQKSERNEALSYGPGGSASVEESPTVPVQETEQCMKSSGRKLDGVEIGIKEPASCVNASLLPAGSDVAVKLDFDLNEDFSVDDGNHGEFVKSSIPGNSSVIHFPCPLPFPIPSMSGSFPSSITVAAAAKGSFFPPEIPLRTKGEMGWKGSAATSAFRPAEPRKVLEMPPSSTFAPFSDDTPSKQVRPPFDIDLNVPDQRILEDVAFSQNSTRATYSGSGSRDHSGGGLDLDLNRVDESSEIGQFSFSNSGRLEVQQFLGRSSLSGGFSNGELNASRDFDLNNGPGPDEVLVTETVPHAKNNVPFLSPIPGVRMSSTDLAKYSSWLPQGDSYSAITIPSIFPGRGEQSYPVVTGTTSQRVVGPPTGGSSFGPEIYRGAVLSSSPAITIPPTTPFQYPGFPFDTSFPVTSNSYLGCSTAYMDSPSGGSLCFPALTPQLVGPTAGVSSHYPRSYVMSLPVGASNTGLESRKWGGQGLDLNAGPAVADDRRDERLPSALRQLPVACSQALADDQLKMYQMAGVLKRKEPDSGVVDDRRDERLPSALRQLPVACSQALADDQLKMYQMTGVLKRKEPDSGWDGDRIRYKQPSWQ
ncbi:uncharacterized protein LOC132283280 [Cornus florida]|uniref:uncharacterized protein LOC132283280 n=1 Tax=Cornus florida TaxID=4283 RepID=UPI00289FB252|nr:uncharacterized protein LOC132283280 [Cornus florida]